MKRNRLLLFASLFALASCAGKGNEASSSLSSNVEESSAITSEEPIQTEFIDAKKSPDYPSISEDIVYTTYYFDSVSGDDNNEGLDEAHPKKSLDAAAGIAKNAKESTPTKLLFKAGSEYTGKLTLEKFKAKDESPLIVDVYGKSESASYCKINGRSNDNCIEVKASNIRLGGFELTAPDGFRGIHVTTPKKDAMTNVVIHDNYIHDINFKLGSYVLPTDQSELDSTSIQNICPDSRFSYNCGGIIFEADTPLAKGASWYENIWVDDNIIERVARTGIWVFSNWAQRPGIDWGSNPYYSDDIGWYPHHNVNIRGNDIFYSGGDGVIIGASVDGFIEYNTCYHAQCLPRPNYVCAGIWSHSCKNFVFQFNESAYTHTARDGEGFDIDIGNSDILFQYNYAHHNDGGGLLCCNTTTNLVKYDEEGEMVLDEDGLPIIEKTMAPWHDITVKNNVFSDNSNGNIIYSGTVKNIDFSNNTIVMSGEIANERVIDTKDFQTGIPGEGWTISNNIFYMRKTNTVRFEMSFSVEGGYTYANNVYYNFPSDIEETMKGYGENSFVEKNPQFVSDVAELGYDKIFNFIPQNKEMFQGGIDLKTMLRFDANGNDVANLRYFGAFATSGKESL